VGLYQVIKCSARVSTLVPNDSAQLRRPGAVLSEISDDWETERAFMKMEAR
jgi:hypothetical protein